MRALEGKVAIVTGGSRGIGEKIVLKLASEGAIVVINYANSANRSEKLAEHIISEGGGALAVQGDISKIEDIKKLFSITIKTFGKIDILINNAGVMITKPIDQITEEDFDVQFSTNVKGTYFSIKEAYHYLEEGGRIINISTSVIGNMVPAYSVYAGTKSAVEQFTRQLAKEFGPRNITINAIAPGPVATELFFQGKSEQQIEAFKNMNAFRRLGTPDDIADSISLLLRDESSWITGQTLRVNGGFL
ncbi:SDR family oxidoreductase [Sutcliffiella halmapala]|uniref:SDR family oxidoreductase n=1 Tax=Sutcliffiella halmapala TaxID=79882 RepID=UPI0009958AD2|nr:SDR family oxidoreductase [Sutcliffiella halmapala]